MEGSLEQIAGGGFGETGMVGRGRSASESTSLMMGGECPGEVAALLEGEVIGETINGGTIPATGKRAVNVEEGWEREDLSGKIRAGELPALEGETVRGVGEKRRRCATASGGEFLGEGEASTGGSRNGKFHRGEIDKNRPSFHYNHHDCHSSS